MGPIVSWRMNHAPIMYIILIRGRNLIVRDIARARTRGVHMIIRSCSRLRFVVSVLSSASV